MSATGIYLVYDDTTGGDDITFKTVNGGGIILDPGVATWCWCDGTDIDRKGSVNIADMAVIATEWLQCRDLNDSTCQ